MSPEIIRTRWADGAMGALLGAAGGGGAMLAVLNPFVNLRFENHNTFWHAGQWALGLLNSAGIKTQAWTNYQEYLSYMDAANHSLIIPVCFTLTTATAIMGALTLGWRFGKPRNSLVYLRGGKVLRGEAALKVSANSFKKDEKKGLTISPNFAISHTRERAHWLLAGGTGSGKSVVLWNLSYPAWQRGDRILIIDYKGFTENWHGQLGKDTLF